MDCHEDDWKVFGARWCRLLGVVWLNYMQMLFKSQHNVFFWYTLLELRSRATPDTSMSILCVLHDLRDDCRAGFAPAVCHLLRERELDDLHKLRFCFKLDPVRNVFEDKSQSSLAHDCARPAIFKVSACLPGAGDTRGDVAAALNVWEFQKALPMLKCVLFQPQASAYLWFCTDREVESLSEVGSMLAMGAIEFTSYLYENIELGRLRVFSKEWPLDCILRHVASNHGIVCVSVQVMYLDQQYLGLPTCWSRRHMRA